LAVRVCYRTFFIRNGADHQVAAATFRCQKRVSNPAKLRQTISALRCKGNHKMQVRDVMSSPAITVTPQTGIQAVARLMRENQISGVPVVDAAGALVGIVTELDLIARNAPLRQPSYLTFLSAMIPLNPSEYRQYKEQALQALASNAGELMGHDDLEAATVSPNTDMDEVMRRMLNPKLTLLPVVEHGRVVGVITRTDVVRLIEKLELELLRRNQG
jgi:CBS domain-containing protein